ncbi:MAG: hypothetical protein CL910_19950 [Deltaproteobacteria bacterium]|jgi:hypothetical protein|nr:hypothetical protein [Deltaproteobacteria bacterium]
MDEGRRRFLHGLSGAAVTAATLGWPRAASPMAKGSDAPELLAAELYRGLGPNQRDEIAFPWNHIDGERGLLRARVAASWQITRPSLDSDFFSADQRALVRAIFEGIIDPAWHERYDRQLTDDAGGWGRHQSIGLFGEPGGPFQLIMSGRHMTLRAGNEPAPAAAFGGPVFYGHATGTWWSGSFVERAHHPGNVFFHQAEAASALYDLLDGAQRERARIAEAPPEHDIGFSAEGARRGLALAELSADQLGEAGRLFDVLVAPFRESDRRQVREAIAAQGGLTACHLSFFEPWYRRGDELWDSFRIEGPSLTWHFRGDPHVHVWAHVARRPDVPVNAVPIER